MRVRNYETGDSYFSKRRRRFDADRMPRALNFCCYHQFPFLARDRSRMWFLEALQTEREKWPIDLWAYVLMPEHVHLLVAPREPTVKVGLFAGNVKEIVARKGIKWMEENAPQWLSKITVQEGQKTRRRFWQPGGGYDKNIEEMEAIHGFIEYIHANPVRRGLVERPEDWEWSSARWYAGLRPVHMEMDRTIPVWYQ